MKTKIIQDEDETYSVYVNGVLISNGWLTHEGATVHARRLAHHNSYIPVVEDLMKMLRCEGWSVTPDKGWEDLETFNIKATRRYWVEKDPSPVKKKEFRINMMIVTADLHFHEIVADWSFNTNEADSAFSEVWEKFVEKYEDKAEPEDEDLQDEEISETITETELRLLECCQSPLEWRTVCDAIKKSRGGVYPSDWWAKVVQSGKADRIMKRWGGSTKLKITEIN